MADLFELRQAIADQAELDAFVKRHAQEADAWQNLAKAYQKRRGCVVQAAEWLSRELDATRVDDSKKNVLVDTIRGTSDSLSEALTLQVTAAQHVATAARFSSFRSKGRPEAGLVNARLAELVDGVSSSKGQPVLRERQLDYVAALAQLCGVIEKDARVPRGALRNRIRSPRVRAPLALLEAMREGFLAMPLKNPKRDETFGQALHTFGLDRVCDFRFDRRQVERDLVTKLDDWRGLLRSEVQEARPILRLLVPDRITFEPAEVDGVLGCRYRGVFQLGALFEGLISGQERGCPQRGLYVCGQSNG